MIAAAIRPAAQSDGLADMSLVDIAAIVATHGANSPLDEALLSARQWGKNYT